MNLLRQMTQFEEQYETRQKIIERLNFNKWLYLVWCEFDYNYARPLLVYDFPNVVKNHDNLANKISKIEVSKK